MHFFDSIRFLIGFRCSWSKNCTANSYVRTSQFDLSRTKATFIELFNTHPCYFQIVNMVSFSMTKYLGILLRFFYRLRFLGNPKT